MSRPLTAKQIRQLLIAYKQSAQHDITDDMKINFGAVLTVNLQEAKIGNARLRALLDDLYGMLQSLKPEQTVPNFEIVVSLLHPNEEGVANKLNDRYAKVIEVNQKAEELQKPAKKAVKVKNEKAELS